MTTPARWERGRLEPVPWQRMAWVVWRQHRGTWIGIVAAFGLAALAVWLVGLHLHQAYAPIASCHPASSSVCQYDRQQFALQNYAGLPSLLPVLLQVMAPLMGALAGAPLLASEFETGTFRYAWTQGFGPARWVLAQVIPFAALMAGAGVAFSQLIAWAYHPIVEEAQLQTPLTPTFFDLRGVDLAAWTVFAFALGVLAGALLRRLMPALLATLALWTGLAVVTASYLRPHYAAPLHTHGQVGPLAWILSQQWMRHGRPVTLATVSRILHHQVHLQVNGPFGVHFSTSQGAGGGFQNASPIVGYLVRHGFKLWTVYQPASRFGLFQTIEGTWLLALSLLLLAAVVWRVSHRGG